MFVYYIDKGKKQRRSIIEIASGKESIQDGSEFGIQAFLTNTSVFTYCNFR